MAPADPAGSAALVVLAGGSGSRVGAAANKVYLPLGGRRVISWSFVWAREVIEIGRFVLVVRAADTALAAQVLAAEVPGLPVEVVCGGDTRHASEQAALDLLAPAIRAGHVQVVAIHDGARPLSGPDLFRSAIRTARRWGGAIPAVPADDVLPADGALPADDGGRVMAVQTPQAFRAPELLAAYAAAGGTGFRGTDTASCLEAHSTLTVRVVPGSRRNLKVTFRHDLVAAERLLAGTGQPGS